MNLSDQSIDLIVSNNGLNNVDDLDQVLSECARVARRGAQFLATMNLETTMLEFYDVMEKVLRDQMLLEEIEGMKRHIYSKRKPLNEITSLMEQRGFGITRISEDQFAYKFSSGTAMLNHRFMRLWFVSAWKSIVPSHHQDQVFREIESRLNAVAETNGGLSLSVPFALIEGERM